MILLPCLEIRAQLSSVHKTVYVGKLIMMVEKSEKSSKSQRAGRFLPWFNLALAIILVGLGIWYLSGKLTLGEIATALSLADIRYILLALVLTLITMLIKTFRWQLMFVTPDESYDFSPFFWSLILGQYVNLIVPFLRLGEIARIFALNRQIDMPMTRTLATLVLEKVLDMFVFVVGIALLLPLVILPEFMDEPNRFIWILPAIALLILYLIGYQTERIVSLFSALEERVPIRLAKRILRWSQTGLEGLSSLRSPGLSILLVGLSVLIFVLSILVPFYIFAAFNMDLGIVEAAVIHIVVTIATTPPSTPGKIGVFNGVVALTLLSLGLDDEAVIISYSIVFYLVVVVPQIVLGIIAAARTDWRWSKVKEHRLAM